MRNLKDIFKLEDSENPSWHLDVAQECAMDGNLGSMQYHLSELLYNEFAQIKSDGEMKQAFRFTKIPNIGNTWEENPVIRDILNNSITLSNPLGFNDPMDPILRQWLRIQKKTTNDGIEKNQFGMLGKVLKDNLRISCLVVPKVSRFLFKSAQPSIQD